MTAGLQVQSGRALKRAIMRAAMDAPTVGPQQQACSRMATRMARKPQSPSPGPAKHDESWVSVCDWLLEHGIKVKSRQAHEHRS